MIIAVFIFSMLLFASYAALIIYYRKSWLDLPEVHSLNIDAPKKNTTKISVIIPARNEEQNIKDCLNSVCDQSYPQSFFEVLVIDDYSEDNTANIITSFAAKNVQLISLKEITGGQKFNSYKKKAIEIAVAKSSGALIVTTDADCIVPHHWLQTIADFYEATNAAFIAMPVSFFAPFKKDKPFTKFLKIFQSLDFMTLQGITGASVFKKAHSMCNGANLAYTKKAFDEVGGFKGIDAIASGDDMLLMHKIYKRYPCGVAFLKSANVIVQTKPMETLKAFIHQRIRWASKADKYDDKRIFAVLLLVYFFNVWCLVLFFLPPSLYPIPFFPLIIVTLKCAVELFFLYPVAKFFGQQKILWWFPFAQPFHIIYTIIAGWLGKFGSYQWKERKVN